MIISLLLIIIGFLLLISGANWMVNGASSLAKKYKVSDLAIGLTIVAFGTSAPELVVNIIASGGGHADIVLGNIIGSNNFNLFIILGLSGVILPISVQSSTAWREIPISLAVALILLLFANDFFISETPEVSRIDGGIMFIMFLLFLYFVFTQMRKEVVENAEIAHKSTIRIWGLILLGLAGLIIGGQIVVNNSIEIANELGLSEKIIGLTIIAAGTSLPELVTSIVAAFKKNSDIAIGNVIGSNIFNILLILSISSLINPIGFNNNFNSDLFFLIGGTAFLLIAMISGRRKRLDRWEAGVLLGVYLCYSINLVIMEI